MSKKDINVPNIGEFKDVEVIEVLIKKGQKIKKNDPLITIESEKELKKIKKVVALPKNQLSKEVDQKENKETGDKIIKVSSTKTSA